MTNVMKKISALLLTLALVVTMMPFLAAPANAETKAFDVAVNGNVIGEISRESLTDPDYAVGPQVFPFATQKGGGSFSYTVAKGRSYESVLQEALGIESLDEIGKTRIQWLKNGSTVNNFTLSVEDLKLATSNFKLTNGTDDNEITENFSTEQNLCAAPRTEAGYETVTPIIAYGETEKLTFAAASEMVNLDSWTPASTNIRAYVGGILRDEDVWLKKGGDQDGGKSFNYVGKFSISDPDTLNILIDQPAEPEKSSLKMKVGDAGQALSTKYSDKEIDLLCYAIGENAFVSWMNDDPSVADIDDSGKLVPLKAGTTKITMGIYPDDAAEQYDVVIAEWDVTVEANTPSVTPSTPAPVVSKPAPAKPTGLKVKNVKKKTAKISWAQAANAEGYEVFRSTKKKKGYKMVADVQTNNYKNKKLKKKKTYYYKVRSYNVVNGQKVYSSFSTAKKVKIKK